MTYDLEKRLVIGLASSALYDLSEADKVFESEGEVGYREYQRQHQLTILSEGVAFSFIKRLLAINEIRPRDPLIEVVLLSRNDPETGLRVMNSIKHHGLDISRAAFLQGRDPYKYIPALSICLFLSANQLDVRQAVCAGYPAGQVLPSASNDIIDDQELRIAFDFDGVLADDESESVYQINKSVSEFHKHESDRRDVPHNPGPLKNFLAKLSGIQALEQEHAKINAIYEPRIRISIVTARSAPSHERVINTMRSWGITVNEAFFLGGIDKSKVLSVLNPHMFFDDQRGHLLSTAALLPSVHVPFGVTNNDAGAPDSSQQMPTNGVIGS